MKNRDCSFVDGNQRFGFRATGVLLRDGKILIQRGVNDVDYALPGGHVALLETSAEALVREYKEELGVDIIVGRMIWVEEVFWKWGEWDAHTICHYHLVYLSEDSSLSMERIFNSLETDVSRLLFQWVDINDLEKYKIYPEFLKKELCNLSNDIKHFVTRE